MNSEPRNILFVVNNSLYRNERSYNSLRLALNLAKRPERKVRFFMTGDGVLCARRGQKTPDSYDNIERMIKSLACYGQVAA